MDFAAIFLILAAAGCHATWNFLIKKLNGGPELVWLFSFVTSFLYLPLVLAVIVIERPEFGWIEFLFLGGSGFLHLAYFLLLQQGYRHGDLSVVYPTARASGPLLSITFAVLILGEHMTTQILMGGLAIIIGVFFLTGGFRGGATNLRASLLFGLATGVLIGSYTAWDAYAVTALMISPVIVDYASAIVRSVALAPYAALHKTRVTGLWRDHKGSVIVIALLNSLAYILFLIAVTLTPLVYAAPAREISVLLTVMLGTLILKEGRFRDRMIWAGLILMGMVLLATG
ncbi:MAG: hypothetical protein CMN55_07205 [Sneathiella sp.]|jgi:drug/metabolite transporter (DMT)-like permease|uniref:DMT family transporter n=1 Tax=Sneathiella sp. TaxID=1964365 RepID=UPI000C484E95|nr:DMT family transporter [Sneathiella sp.]MAL78888.1 hypothetical protein [Sneathiella sp.]